VFPTLDSRALLTVAKQSLLLHIDLLACLDLTKAHLLPSPFFRLQGALRRRREQSSKGTNSATINRFDLKIVIQTSVLQRAANQLYRER
jgi:hypothetical protein